MTCVSHPRYNRVLVAYFNKDLNGDDDWTWAQTLELTTYYRRESVKRADLMTQQAAHDSSLQVLE